MDQLKRMQTIIHRLDQYGTTTALELDPEISSTTGFLKLMKVKCDNWQSPLFEKIGALRFAVNIPSLDALNLIIYPRHNSDAPIFLVFFLLMRKKVICHFNLNTCFKNEDYLDKWIRPLDTLQSNYPSFESNNKYPEWMDYYRHSNTVYGMYPENRLQDLDSCMFDYLEHYLQQISNSPEITDPDRLIAIEKMHERFKLDIRTRDKAQGMTAKFIGKQKSRRIFYEVVT